MPGPSLRSTSWSCPQEVVPCSSAEWHSLHLNIISQTLLFIRNKQTSTDSALEFDNNVQCLTFYILDDHAQVSACLEGAKHANYKGVFCKRQDVSLHKCLLYLVSQNQVLSVDFFHRESLASFFMPYQIHGPAGEMENIAGYITDLYKQQAA